MMLLLYFRKQYWIKVDSDDAIVVLQETVILKSENFDNYNNGDSIIDVNNDFITWSGTSTDTAFVSNDQSNSGSNSLKIETGQDVVYLKNNYTTGKYEINFKMFIPSGYAGFFNIQKTENPGKDWALQVYFNSDGTVTGNAGDDQDGNSILLDLNHNYNHDMWNQIIFTIDLNNNTCMYKFNNEYSFSFKYNQSYDKYLGLGSINFFGNTNHLYYIDDIEFRQIE